MLIDAMREQHDVQDRQNSLLSNRDRQYLLGKTSYSESYEANIRQQIRERVTSGLLDFPIVAHHLAADQLAQIFDPTRGLLTDGEHIPDYYKFYHANWGPMWRIEAGPLDMLREADELEGAPERRVARTVYREAVTDAITFLFRGILSSDLPLDFEKIVETALTRTLQEDGKSATVDIETHDLTIAQLEDKLATNQLNRAEIQYYLEQTTHL